MADISKITTLDGTTYDLKDATARALIADLPSGGGAQSDWNENDSTSVSYILNRTHWDDTETTVVFEKATVSFQPDSNNYNTAATVTMMNVPAYDQNTQICISVDDARNYIGKYNSDEITYLLDDAGNVTILQINGNSATINLDGSVYPYPNTSTEHLIEISMTSGGVHKIDSKYLPDSVTTGLHNLVDGSKTGSVRGIGTTEEGQNIPGTGNSYAIGLYAYAEGYETAAQSSYSHTEGYRTVTFAGGSGAHAEGYETWAQNTAAHAEGNGTKAKASASHAEGFNTLAGGYHSHAEGSGTIALKASQHTFGAYNIADLVGDDTISSYIVTERGNYVEIVGNGTADDARSNARTLDWSGNEWLAGGESIGGDLVLRDGNIYLDTDQFTLGTMPSENIYPLNRIYFRDANGNHVGQLYHHYLSNGEAGVLIEAKRSINDENIYNTMRLSIDDSGNKTVALSDGGLPFRKALGLGTNGALPITVAQGGTGVTTATKNQVFAAPNGSNGAPGFRALVAADIPTLATSKISGLDTALDGKVSTAGDTMTGTLTLAKSDESIIYLKNTAAALGTAPSSDAYTGQLGFRTSTNLTIGWVDNRYTKAKEVDTRIAARNNGTGSNVDNVLVIGVKNDGTRTITVSEAAPWRTALGLGAAATRGVDTAPTSGATDLITSGGVYTALDGKVSTAGDTMTGNLTMKAASVPIRQATAKVGTTPSSTLYTGMFAAQDSAGTNIGYVRGFFGTDGAIGMQFECVRAVSGSNKYHNLSLRMKADGTRQVTVTEQAPWLLGLGLAPENITSSVTKVTTMPSGISKINNLTVWRAGYLVQVYISVLPTASPPTAWVNIASGLPAPVLGPIVNGRYWENSTAQPALFQVSSDGHLQVAWGAGSKNQVATLVYIAKTL